jgi:ATP-dependent Lon protease
MNKSKTREARLRQVQPNLPAIKRKRARKKAEGEEGAWVIDVDKVEEVLGIPRYAVEEVDMVPEVGVVTGLAWTATGGDLMVIEALRMPGSGRLTVTGQLGDVMRESVDAAHSYVRSRAAQIGIPDEAFKEYDVHVHLPAGAIPKDGPSAGISLTLAIASALSQRPVRRDVAMTGEVTLRGKVLEIGGVKEKVLAAYRAGLRQLIMPKANEKDLREVPEEVKKQIAFTFVPTMDDVLRLALLPSHSETEVPTETDEGDLLSADSTPSLPIEREAALRPTAERV